MLKEIKNDLEYQKNALLLLILILKDKINKQNNKETLIARSV